jgi:predicted nucleic acid binding AN1-type Zn finger protein
MTVYSNSKQKKKKSESILQQKWQRNNFDTKDNAYELLTLAYIVSDLSHEEPLLA